MQQLYNYFADRTLAYMALDVTPAMIKNADDPSLGTAPPTGLGVAGTGGSTSPTPVSPRVLGVGFRDDPSGGRVPYVVGTPLYTNNWPDTGAILREQYGLDPKAVAELQWNVTHNPAPVYEVTSADGKTYKFYRQGTKLYPVYDPDDTFQYEAHPLISSEIKKLISGPRASQPATSPAQAMAAFWPGLIFGMGGMPMGGMPMQGGMPFGMMPGMFGMPPWMMPGMFGMPPWMMPGMFGMPGFGMM